VSQDPLGKQGLRLSTKNSLSVWYKPLSGGKVALAMVSERTDDVPYEITVKFSDVGISASNVLVRNIFEHRDHGKFSGTFSAWVPSHSVVFVLLSPLH
jgi:alpha-galactosidase